MCTFTYDYVQYETSISIWDNWNDDRTKMIDLLSFHFATRINSQNKYKYNILNEPWHINLYMNIGISNWHNWRFDTTKMTFFTLFQFLTRLLNTKSLNLFCTYLVRRYGEMWKTCYSDPQNAKKENQLKHKNQVRNRLFIDRQVFYFEGLHFSLRGEHIKVIV